MLPLLATSVFILSWFSIILSTDSYAHNTVNRRMETNRDKRAIRPIGISASHPFSRTLVCSTKLSMSSSEEIQPGTNSKYAEDIKKTLLWVGAAAVFGIGLTATQGTSAGIEFVSGYVLEQCLSVDNLFVFLLLFDYFKIAKEYQEKILNYGIYGALILRGIFVGLGAVALQQFHQVLLLFAGVLFFSSYKILFKGDGDGEEEDLSKNAVVKFAKSNFKTTDQLDGDKFFIEAPVEGGQVGQMVRLATPLFLCLVCIELSDVVFAFDSVPAIFGVTANPFIVYTSNIFAIAGLRALYGVLSEAVQELEYLEKAVGLVLAVVAAKMTFSTFDIELFTPVQSLLVVLGILAGGVGLSLNSEKDAQESAVQLPVDEGASVDAHQ